MAVIIPDKFLQTTQNFPESSYGANRVTLILSNGKKIKGVMLAWGSEIVKVDNIPVSDEKDIDFKLSEIRSVLSEI